MTASHLDAAAADNWHTCAMPPDVKSLLHASTECMITIDLSHVAADKCLTLLAQSKDAASRLLAAEPNARTFIVPDVLAPIAAAADLSRTATRLARKAVKQAARAAHLPAHPFFAECGGDFSATTVIAETHVHAAAHAADNARTAARSVARARKSMAATLARRTWGIAEVAVKKEPTGK